MADFVTIKMKTLVDFEAALDLLPDDDPLKKYQPGNRIFLSDLGLRELLRERGAQAVYMEHWDGVSGVIDIADILLRDLAALNANAGRIKFLMTDDMRASIEFGALKRFIDAGLFENEGFSVYV